MTDFDLTDWNPVALEVVQSLHPTPVYTEHRLTSFASKVQGQTPRSRQAEAEATRRKETCRVSEELSKYYELPEGWTGWSYMDLLWRGEYARGHSSAISLLTYIPSVLKDVENLHKPPTV